MTVNRDTVLPSVLKRLSVSAVLWTADRLGVNRLLRSRRRRIPVTVMYHGVTDRQRPDLNHSRHVTVAEFDAQLAMLKKQFTIVSARELVEAVRRPTPAARRLLTLTFDDGYENNLLSAVPVLQSHGLTACFFVSTYPVLAGTWGDSDLLELAVLYARSEGFEVNWKGRRIALRFGNAADRLRENRQLRQLVWRGQVESLWKEKTAFAAEVYRRAGCPEPPAEYRQQYSFLSPDQVGELARQGMEVGSHTVHHLELAECGDEEIAEELAGASRDVQKMTGIPANDQLLAYPVGSYDERVMRIAREFGHPAAFAVNSPFQPALDHLYELPRTGVARGASLSCVAAQVSGLLNDLRSLARHGG